MDEAGRFVHRNLDWVREHLGRVPPPMPFVDGAEIPLRGRVHRVSFVGPARGRDIVRIEQGPGAPASLVVSGRPEHAARRLKDWLLGQARQDFEKRVRWHARTLGVRVRRIAIRDQRSRWGSCSVNGHLSFSWRLIFAPPFVLDYVAAHEVAHLLAMDHGRRFWNLVARCVPRLEEAKAWLRRHGSDLHRYGAEPESARS
jgi:predicted metal-dependent hydrolase